MLLAHTSPVYTTRIHNKDFHCGLESGADPGEQVGDAGGTGSDRGRGLHGRLMVRCHASALVLYMHALSLIEG